MHTLCAYLAFRPRTESRHFNDEAERYASGNLREVMFYPDQLRGHIERTYHPRRVATLWHLPVQSRTWS